MFLSSATVEKALEAMDPDVLVCHPDVAFNVLADHDFRAGPHLLLRTVARSAAARPLHLVIDRFVGDARLVDPDPADGTLGWRVLVHDLEWVAANDPGRPGFFDRKLVRLKDLELAGSAQVMGARFEQLGSWLEWAALSRIGVPAEVLQIRLDEMVADAEAMRARVLRHVAELNPTKRL